MRSLLLAALLCAPASTLAAKNTFIEGGTRTITGYDEFLFLGWKDGCSAALQYFSYPPLGTVMAGLPDTWLIGSITIPPDTVDPKARWVSRGISALAWRKSEAIQLTEVLVREGYVPNGHIERIRDAQVAVRPGLAHVIHSTTAFRLGYRTKWPPKRYRLRTIHYSPLGTCALMVFRYPKRPRRSYRWKLVRLLNPDVRRKRARAHVTNGLLLYKEADLYGAEEELEIAADMDPEYPTALYHHSRLLAAHGRFDEALISLGAAVDRDQRFQFSAKKAIEFQELHRRPVFKDIVGGKRWRLFKREFDDEFEETER